MAPGAAAGCTSASPGLGTQGRGRGVPVLLVTLAAFAGPSRSEGRLDRRPPLSRDRVMPGLPVMFTHPLFRRNRVGREGLPQPNPRASKTPLV